MKNSKAFLANFNFFLMSSKNKYYTSTILLGRLNRKNKRNSTKDPGWNKAKMQIEQDLEYLENSDIENLESDNLDLMKTDLIYDEYEKERKAWHNKVGRMITAQKFFASARQPQMLTYNEKMCIKYLHTQDPVQWNVRALSECFPATPSIIQKILKSKWKPVKERIIKMDKEVQNNWKLLEEGKLDADPQLIEHLKKFTNKHRILLEQIKSEKFYLPEVKREKVWNHGEMSSILESYEKSINSLIGFNHEKLNQKLIPNKNNSAMVQIDDTSATQELHKKIDEKLEELDVEGKESFTLDKRINHIGDLITYEELSSRIKKKFESQEKLDLPERAILEFEKKKLNLNNLKNHPPKNLNSELDDNKDIFQDSDKDTLNKLYEPFLSEKKMEIEKSIELKSSREYKLQNLKRKYFSDANKKSDCVFQTGTNTKLGNELEVGKILEKNCQSIMKSEKLSVKRFNQLMRDNPERAVKDEAFYEKEVEEIKHTAFWNNMENSKKKALRESEKKTMKAPTSADVFNADSYPQRIKIPINQKGSGLTFKLRDCYYDDDGEFLYRVPGMKS